MHSQLKRHHHPPGPNCSRLSPADEDGVLARRQRRQSLCWVRVVEGAVDGLLGRLSSSVLHTSLFQLKRNWLPILTKGVIFLELFVFIKFLACLWYHKNLSFHFLCVDWLL